MSPSSSTPTRSTKPTDSHSATPVSRGTPLLKVRGLKKEFGKLSVLNGIDLDAYESDVITILGASGSGKSTFLRCLNFLEIADSGRIVLSGESHELTGQTPPPAVTKSFRTKIGMVFQSFNLWSHLTAGENIMEPLIYVLNWPRKKAYARAEELLEKVKLASHMGHYPAQLSGGQKQRVAIARALAIEPKLVLFDEPTSALDPELVFEVLGVIKKLAEEKLTMLIVSHEIKFAKEVSTRTAFFHAGQVLETAPTNELFANPSSPELKQFLRHHES